MLEVNPPVSSGNLFKDITQMSTPIKPWKRKKPELAFAARVFELYKERLKIPSKEYEDDFFYINSVDWVNIIAITDNSEVVMVEQYRVGIDQVTLELPGGILDHKDELASKAAERELLEETGYGGAELVSLGSIHPNPALINNVSHAFLARGVKKIQEPALDPAEQIRTKLVPFADIPQLIQEGKLSHSLHVATFYLLGLEPTKY
jgi:8-oxo-dGTP pyrophosphatase MutT (NUDIX family)